MSDNASKKEQKNAEKEAFRRRLIEVAAEREATKQAVKAEKEARRSAKVLKKEQTLQMTGSAILDVFFEKTRVRLFENGYIQLDWLGIPSLPEKLVSIDGSVDIIRKSSTGRGAAGIASTALLGMPVNMLSPSNRGDLLLIIITEKSSHKLHSTNPTSSNIENLKLIEVRGKALLESLKKSVQGAKSQDKTLQENSEAPISLAQELEKLSELRNKGLLSEEEFKQAKKKLIS